MTTDHSVRHPTRLERTAYHEAGHVIVAHLRRRPISAVDVIRSGDWLGLCSLQRFKDFHPDYELKRRTESMADSFVMIAYAGMMTEWWLTKRLNRVGASDDLSKALVVAQYRYAIWEELGAYLDFIRVQTKWLIRFPPNWSAVQALAAELIQKRTVGYRRARDIIVKAIQEGWENSEGWDQYQVLFDTVTGAETAGDPP